MSCWDNPEYDWPGDGTTKPSGPPVQVDGLNAPVNGMVPYASDYFMVASDGGLFDYSGRAFDGGLGCTCADSPTIGVAAFAG